MKIPVVFATDNNYLFYTCIAITSMAQSADEDTFYQIYILVDAAFADDGCLLDKLQKRYINIHIQTIPVDEHIFENVIINNSHVTKVTFYRLALCELLKEDKCLYLDADILVTEDLKELYQTDLGDYYIAGCRDLWIDLLSKNDREARCKRTGIPSMSQYVNAGVLLLNLKQLRKDGMADVFRHHVGKNYLYEDQDILNVCCYDKILFLPAKWNLFTLFMGQIQEMKQAGIADEVLEAFNHKTGIIHYATPFIRPWEKESCWMNTDWWQTAKIWETEPIYHMTWQRVVDKERKESWDYYIEQCSLCEKIIIFGFTKYGRELSEWIGKIKDVPEIVFCDNDIKKQGKDYQGLTVKAFSDILRPDTEKILFIVASQSRPGEVIDFLLSQGIKREQIICYKKKDAQYYTYLDKRYYQREFLDLCKKEGYSSQDLIEKYFLKDWLLKE